MKEHNFETLYLENSSSVYRYANFKLNNKELAEDVTSEVFTRVIEKGVAPSIKNVNAWLIGFTRNVIYEKYKEKAKQKDSSQGQSEDIDADVEQDAIKERLKEQIMSEIKELDEITQDVITLKIWQDYKFQEIAEILDQKTNTIKQRYYRGLEQLKINIGLRSYSKKLYSISTPVIIATIASLAKSQNLMASTGFLSTLASNLGLSVNLNIVNSYMSANIASAAATSAASSTATSGILATTGAKIAAIAVTTTAVVAGGAGVAVVSNQMTNTSQTNTISQPVSYGNSKLIIEEVDKECYSESLGLDIRVPNSWNCQDYTGVPTLVASTSDNKYEVRLTVEGNGTICDQMGEECVTEAFHSNEFVTLEHQYIPSSGSIIYGETNLSRTQGNIHIYISERNSTDNITDSLTSAELEQLKDIVDSISETQSMIDYKFSAHVEPTNIEYVFTVQIPEGTTVETKDGGWSGDVFEVANIQLENANLIISFPTETFPRYYLKGEPGVIDNPNLGELSRLFEETDVYYTNGDIYDRPPMCDIGTDKIGLCTDYVIEAADTYFVARCDSTDVGLNECNKVMKSISMVRSEVDAGGGEEPDTQTSKSESYVVSPQPGAYTYSFEFEIPANAKLNKYPDTIAIGDDPDVVATVEFAGGRKLIISIPGSLYPDRFENISANALQNSQFGELSKLWTSEALYYTTEEEDKGPSVCSIGSNDPRPCSEYFMKIPSSTYFVAYCDHPAFGHDLCDGVMQTIKVTAAKN